MKENYRKIEKDLFKLQNSFDWVDTVNCIEMSYILKGQKEIEELDNVIYNYANDGINTFGLFIMICCNKYRKNYNGLSIVDFINEEIENCIKEFITKYFENNE